MLGITIRDKKRNTWIRQQTEVEDVIAHIKLSKWRWAGHLARRSDGRWTKLTTLWKPETGSRRRGRPHARWQDELVNATGGRWWRKARDREDWKIRGEAFVQQWTDYG